MVIAALFVIAKNWKQPKCPSADEWINKLVYLKMVSYSPVKQQSRNIWNKMVDLKIIMLSPERKKRIMYGSIYMKL